MAKIIIDQERCKGCYLCFNVCPKKEIIVSKGLNKKGYHPVEFLDNGTCSGCGHCYLVCPDIAVEVWK